MCAFCKFNKDKFCNERLQKKMQNNMKVQSEKKKQLFYVNDGRSMSEAKTTSECILMLSQSAEFEFFKHNLQSHFKANEWRRYLILRRSLTKDHG